MRILVAPQELKGSLTAAQAAAAIAAGLAHGLPGVEIVELPLADGGPGTRDAGTDRHGCYRPAPGRGVVRGRLRRRESALRTAGRDGCVRSAERRAAGAGADARRRAVPPGRDDRT